MKVQPCVGAVSVCIAGLTSVGCGGDAGSETRAEAKTAQNSATVPTFVLPPVIPAEAGPASGSLPPLADDPGPSKPARCAASAGKNFLVIDDFEPADPGLPGQTLQWYFYGDQSPGEQLPYSGGWEPPTTPIPAAWGVRCDSHVVLHLAGGTFKHYGFGFGSSFAPHAIAAAYHNSPARPDLQPIIRNAAQNPDGSWKQVLDASQYKGLSFWARRGPSGQPGMRVGIVDQSTSDDINRLLPLEQAACRSGYTTCGCNNGKPCSLYAGGNAALGGSAPAPGNYCFDPTTDSLPPDPTLKCGETVCAGNPPSSSAATIPNHVDDGAGVLPCNSFTIKSSNTTASYCFRPGVDPDPPAPTDQCGDAFTASVILTTEWELFLVPFSELRQGGWAKASREFQASAIYSVQFGTSSGNADIWLDDVGLYSVK